MNKTATIKYYDDFTTDSVRIAAQAYGIKIECINPTDSKYEVYVTVSGPTESVDRFLEDVREGDIEPFDSKRELSDDEYEEWLADELGKFGCLYIPTYGNSNDDDDELDY